MENAAGNEPSLEEIVAEIRKVRLQRFFSLSEGELHALSAKHSSMLPYLYEIYRRYGNGMDERMKTAVVIYLLSKDADFEKVYHSLEKDAKNKEEVLEKFAKGGEQVAVYN